MKRSRKVGWILGTSLICLALGPFLAALAAPAERSYAFVPDHPIDMWRDGKDHWAYFGVGFGPSSELADRVRSALVQQGFKEDTSQRPWFRFVSDDQEVIVCDHDQFAVNTGKAGGKLVQTAHAGSANRYQCVLVKNGPGTHEPLLLFRAKKLIHGW